MSGGRSDAVVVMLGARAMLRRACSLRSYASCVRPRFLTFRIPSVLRAIVMRELCASAERMYGL